MMVPLLLAGVWWITGVSRYVDVPPVLTVGLSAVGVARRYVVAVLGRDVVDVFLHPTSLGLVDRAVMNNSRGVQSETARKWVAMKAWVNVYGVPFEISSFLPLWAIGTISGATEKVDMRYTKKMGLVRILVAVTNVNHIPESAEIVVGEWLYEIFFKVDKVLIEGKWMDNDNMGNRDKDDKEQGEDEDYSKKHENDSLQLEELAEDTVMEDNSLHGDSKKPQDGACDMGLVSQLENQIVNGSVTGTGIDPEGLSLGMPTDLMALTSSLDDQYVVTHTPGALDQSLGCGSSDGKSNSWLMQYPRCSSLASVSQGEVEWTLSVPATSRLFLNETTYLSGVAAGMDVEDVCAQPKVSDHSVTLSFESNIQERGSYLGHVNSFAGVPRSILQDALVANSLTKRVKTKKLNHGDLIISAKRINTDEDILTKAQ
uniref:DUF4283 domain-containing protein n=1 Tax=Zea mays TaxID=4577 RepID=A0A804MEL6_MAIZE